MIKAPILALDYAEFLKPTGCTGLAQRVLPLRVCCRPSVGADQSRAPDFSILVFQKLGVAYFGVLIIRILLFRVLYSGPLCSETLI